MKIASSILVQKKTSNIVYGISVLVTVFLFISIICYIRPPIGDDVLGHFKDGVKLYLDDSSVELGERIITFSDAVMEILSVYKLWSGRIFGIFLCNLSGMLNDITKAIITGIILSAIILCANILVYGSIKKALENPSTMIIFFLFAFYFHIGICYTIMWTMLSQYQVALLLVMIYLIFFKKILFSDANINIRRIVVLNLLGWLTGITHEIYTVSLCVFLLAICIFDIVIYKTKIEKLIFCHIGLILGTLICVFSPGNFNRMMQSHDAGIFNSWYIKCINVIKMHISSLAGVRPWRWIIVVILFAFFIFIVYRVVSLRRYVELKAKIKQSPRMILFSLSLYFMLFISSVLWSIVTYVPVYGLPFFNIFFLIPLFSILYYINEHFPNKDGLRTLKLISQKSFVVLFFLLLIFCNANWILSNYKTRLEWDKLIKYANENNLEEVYVPKFEEKYSNRFNFYNRNNDIGDESHEDYKICVLYYNTRVLPK